jgi:hypothetical protein
MVGLVILLVIIVGLIYWISVARRRREERLRLRRAMLMDKYHSEDIVNKIMDKKIWQGMNAEQLEDSWGKPVSIDRMVYKFKTKQTWKYNSNGRNRFRSRVNFEDGLVVGWELK